MSNLLFLLAALGISVLGSIVLWLRARKPVTLESSVDSFAREMRALAPDAERRADGDAARRVPGQQAGGRGPVDGEG